MKKKVLEKLSNIKVFLFPISVAKTKAFFISIISKHISIIGMILYA